MISAEKRAFIFMPWVFLLGITIGAKIGGIYGYFGSMGLIITWYFNKIDIVGLTIEIVFNSTTTPYFMGLFGFLTVALILLHKQSVQKIFLRKLFHILALLLFTPLVIHCHDSNRLLRFTVFAFNAVTVWLIMIEQARPYAPFLQQYFAKYTDDRETELVVTHIYLLFGCAMPVTLSFIIFNGGLFTPEFTVIAFQGILFLGVGDVTACFYGKYKGKSLVREGSKKTVEGCHACWAALTIANAVLIGFVCPFANNYFLVFIITSMITSVVEGFTLQHDNLIGSVVAFVLVT